jgi:hypothetical protein
MWMKQHISKLEQLLLGTKPINQSADTPSDGDVIQYNSTDGDWEIVSAAKKASTSIRVLQANISGDISTNGTTWVDITWEIPTRRDTDAFSVDSASIWTELTLDRGDEGDYVIWCTLTSDFNTNNSQMHLGVFLYNGSTWELIANSERVQHTSSAEGVQVILSGFSYAFSDAAQIKIMGKFAGADAGSVWNEDLCNLYVQFIPD